MTDIILVRNETITKIASFKLGRIFDKKTASSLNTIVEEAHSLIRLLWMVKVKTLNLKK